MTAEDPIDGHAHPRTETRSIFEPHIALFAEQDGGYGICHTYPSIPGKADLNAFDLEVSVLEAAAGLLRMRGENDIADSMNVVSRQARADSVALDSIVQIGGQS